MESLLGENGSDDEFYDCPEVTIIDYYSILLTSRELTSERAGLNIKLGLVHKTIGDN